MIKHHPKFELIQSFVNGDLPASLSIGIAIHADMCALCQQKITQLTEQVAASSFEKNNANAFSTDEPLDDAERMDHVELLSNINADTNQEINEEMNDEINFEAMIENITDSIEVDEITQPVINNITYKNKSYGLPTALNSIQRSKTANIGKLSRTRLQFDEDEIHSSLLHISPGGGVPEHTHKGFELTVLLDGSFSDEIGEYVKGDFLMLDASIKHTPASKKGCLCYTVANDALHFTKGINKLLNPIGTFIY